METETITNKIKPNDMIVRLVKCVNAGENGSFYKLVQEYYESLPLSNSIRYSLRNLLNSKPIYLKSLDELPSATKRLFIKDLPTNDNVFLNTETQDLIEEILIEWNNIPLYQFHNIPIRNKILLHGETGNGKTTIAKHIAKASNLPFIQIKSDEVIDSRLGGTGTNIFNIFNSITEPCVIFWDEVDSVGCKRGFDVHAAGHENDRMTNSLLVNMEKLKSDVIFIAATNRKDCLDSAFLRRFDTQFEITAPTTIEKVSFAKQLMNFHNIQIENIQYSEYNSYSDIKNKIVAEARKYISSVISSAKTN